MEDQLKELIKAVKSLKRQARAKVGNTKTKMEGHQAQGEVYAYDTVIELLEQYQETGEIPVQ